MAPVTEEVNFKFYVILTDLHLNSNMWLMGTPAVQGGRRKRETRGRKNNLEKDFLG